MLKVSRRLDLDKHAARLGHGVYQIGERVPDFSLPDQHGRIHTLESIMGPNGAMVLFHRSADW